ncbi:SDR family NAD(P)-dependent oxidoreductase, partial [Mesorhizobium sp. M7A.F.Ca.CA.004.04.1.1]
MIVTGAARGLGLACAERFHADGAKVVLVDIQADRGREHAERLGERAAWLSADLSECTEEK